MKKKNKVQSEPTQRISYEEQSRILDLALSKLSEELGYPIEIRDMNWKPPAEITSGSMRPLSVKPKNTGGKNEKEK